jgi:flagellar assembly protein FliH
MSTSSEPAFSRSSRSAVLRGGDAAGARPARIDADLRTSPFTPLNAVDARLTDPHLEQVVAAAKRQAVAEGHTEGHAAGYAAGRAVADAEALVTAQAIAQQQAGAEARRQAEVAQALDVLGRAADGFRQREAVSVAEVEDVVVDLALQVARAVLDREIASSTDPGRDALARALVLAPTDCPATARLHPDDAAALGPVDDLAAARRLVVVPDPSVERGGCVVDAAGRQIDAQVGPALARVAAALRGPA